MRKVKNIETGKEGFVIDDSFRCCDASEDLVVYDGTKHGSGTDRTLLKEVPFVLPIPDLTKCGAGQGKYCCIFITVGPNGSVCERFTALRNTLIFRTMTAKRNPEQPYPKCMVFADKKE